MVGLVVASGCMGGSKPSGTSPTTPVSSTASSHSSTTQSTSSGPTSTGTSTGTPQTSTTTTQIEELYWSSPWQYSTVKVEGREYKVTYYKVDYKIRPNQSTPLYEYVIEKTLKKAKVHVYGTDFNGNKVDLGEKEVYEYTTVVVPVKAAQLKDRLVIKVWYLKESGDFFVYPWEATWFMYMNAGSNEDFVGFKFEYGDKSFTVTSPAPFQSGLMPYMEGTGDFMSDINQDLTNLYMGWLAAMQLGIWSALSDENLAVPRSGTWTDMMGHTWAWSTKPDGSVTFSGVKFKLVDAQWKYSGSPEGISMDGKAKIAPGLFLPVEVDGHFGYRDEATGKSVVVYSHMKVEDLKLEKVS